MTGWSMTRTDLLLSVTGWSMTRTDLLLLFRDRLVDDKDRSWFDELMHKLLEKRFDKKWKEVVDDDRIIYGDYLVQGEKAYGEIKDLQQLRTSIETYLEDYNNQTTKQMKLVMFFNAIEHVSRISRVIRQPKGNMLLLGVGGSGRQSLTRLAASMADYTCFQIEVRKGYGKVEWFDDLKKVLREAGGDGHNTIFLFSDTQVVQEYFLEDINNILNRGEVPNMFDVNDMDAITAQMRPICQQLSLPLTKSSLYSHFLKRVQAHIHMCLAMSPMGELFRSRLRMFPSLVNCCTLDWFTEWPDEALQSVAMESFSHIDFGPPGKVDDEAAHQRKADETKQSVVMTAQFIHQSVASESSRFLAEERRHNYVTPTSYLELLSTFNVLLSAKRTELGTAKRRLTVGLDKLQTTEVEVKELQMTLEKNQPVLIQTTKEVEEMMVQISSDKVSAAATKEVVSKEEAVATTKANECKAIKEDAEADLAEALPALDEALACLKNLKLSDIGEVGKYNTPPALVKVVLEGICIVRQIKPVRVGEAGMKTDDYWPSGKKALGDPRAFLEAMINYDKDNIPTAVITKIKPYPIDTDL